MDKKYWWNILSGVQSRGRSSHVSGVYAVILFLLVGVAESAPPSRQAVYESGSVILSSENTANEDSIYSYLQSGIDTYAPLSIENADISASANIQSDKLNLTSIAQAVGITAAGSFDNNGATSLDGSVTVTGNSTFAGTTIANLGTVTTAAFTAITNLGAVTTADINDGTMDNVQIGGTTATGELIVNDSADAADGLGSQGTTGQFLQSQGAGVNPTWADGVYSLSTTPFTDVALSGNINITSGNRYRVYLTITAISADMTIYIQFDDDTTATDYSWVHDELLFSTSPTSTLTGDDSDSFISLGDFDTANHGAECVLDIDAKVFPADTSSYIAIHGNCATHEASGSLISRKVSGLYKDASSLSSFEFYTSTGTMTGTVEIYEFN